MSYKTGGEIEKGGNQYESNALVYYFAKLLNDEILYIQSESYETELEKGMDIIIKRKDDSIFVVQAKSRDGEDDIWSLGKLNRHNIIKNACHHILNGRDFHLVSPLDFTVLKDWCNQSRGFVEYKKFEEFILGNNTSGQKVSLFEKIVAKINLYFDGKSPIKFFHHFYLDFLPDDKQYVVDSLASYGKICEPNKAFALLDHYCTKNNKLGQPIYVSEIRKFLQEQGITFFNIDNQSASLTLNELQDKFLANYERKLINGKWLARDEQKRLNEILRYQKIAIISGQSGTGKSALLYKFCKELKSRSEIFLPLSFEVNCPQNNLLKYGQELGFTASPVEVLKKLSDGQICYLIIDQLDSIKWENVDWNSSFEACCSLVKECDKIPNLKVIFACRTIDADRILGFWKSSDIKMSECQIDLSYLSEDSVRSIVNVERYTNLSQSTRDMLRNARNLKLYTDVCFAKDYVPTTNMIQDFIGIKHKELLDKGFSIDEITKLHNYLVSELRASNSNTIPQYSINEKFRTELIYAYCSTGIIEITSNHLVKFTHQSILDYYLVKELVAKLDKGQSIVRIIKQYNVNPLSGLEIIKQFIEACYEREEYVDYLEQILFSKRIRWVIKNIVIRALRTLKSNDKANLLYMKVLRSNSYGMKYLYFLSNGNQIFSSFFIEQKEFEGLIKSSDYESNYRAVNILLQANNVKSTRLLAEVAQSSTNYNLLNHIVHSIDDVTASNELFEIKILILKRYILKSYYVNWDKLANTSIERLIKYLIMFLSLENSNKNLINEAKWSENIARAISQDAMKFYILSKEKIESEFDCELKLDIINQHDHYKNLIASVFETTLYLIDEKELMNLIESNLKFFKHAALRAILKCEYNKSLKIFKSLIDNKFILQQDYWRDRQLLEIICELLVKFSVNLSEDVFRNLEEQINEYKSPSILEFAKYRFEQHEQGYYYHFCEEEQKRFLECLPQNRLTDASKQYLTYLKRKFPQKEYYNWTSEMGQVIGYTVVSCIADKWKKFSKKTWHQIMSNPKTGRSGREKMIVNGNGQAVESTLFEFCSTIRIAAHAKPQTFVELAMNYDDLRQPFIEAICDGIYDSNIDDSNTLERCTIEEKLAVYKKYFDIANKKILRSFVWFIERNNVMDLWVYEKLLEIANNPDKYEHNEMNIWSSNWNHDLSTLTIHDLETEKVNRVQTCAIDCLANTLFDKNVLADDIGSVLSKCITATHPVILLASIDIIYPIWNFDKKLVVNNLLDVSQKDLRMLLSTKSLRLLRLALQEYHEKFKPILAIAVDANKKEYENIYKCIVAAYCYHGVYKDLVKLLMKKFGNICLHAATQILIKNKDEETLERAREIILGIHDRGQDNQKLSEKADYIIDADLLNNVKNQSIVIKTLKSNDFFKESYIEYKFVYEIKKLTSLIPVRRVIKTYCELFLQKKDDYSCEVENLIGVVLRLYLEAIENKRQLVARDSMKLLDKIYSKYVIVQDISYIKDIQ